jgi:hypothetical protein
MNEFARVGFNYGSFYYAYILRWQLLGQDQINNRSTIRVQASIYVGANNISWSSGSASLYNTSFGLSNTYYRGETVVNTQDITVYHDSNGDASIYVGGSINTKFVMNGNCGGTIPLPHIDRNAPSISLSSKTIKEKSATFNYSTNSTLDSLQGKLNNGSWQNISMSNPITLSNLTDDTNYTYQIRGKKSSNQIWGYSNIISFKTVAGTFAMVSVNEGIFKDAEIYVVTESNVEKISKEQYKIIEGDDS